MWAALLSVIVAIIKEVLLSQRSGSVQHGSTPLEETPMQQVLDRAKRSGLLLLLVILCACQSREIVVATLHPVEDATKGWPRVAQDEVTVILDGSGTVGTIAPAGGYFIVHESDLKALLQKAQK